MIFFQQPITLFQKQWFKYLIIYLNHIYTFHKININKMMFKIPFNNLNMQIIISKYQNLDNIKIIFNDLDIIFQKTYELNKYSNEHPQGIITSIMICYDFGIIIKISK